MNNKKKTCLKTLCSLAKTVSKATEMTSGVFKSVSTVNSVKFLSLCLQNRKHSLKNALLSPKLFPKATKMTSGVFKRV
ncbi:hypothetical protein E2C01_074013 [Portunus trituberculatus]|uniref:Uncharacterized protein n=1 Tax=Portunus trituberculatus TaxID=210409 RepID=A0A5B7IFM0_PORTR|nr:hypothetical protein [Portunus trituberculatus]